MNASRQRTGDTPARDRVGEALQWVLLLFLVSQVFAGVLRWALGSVGLQALIYAPTLLLWVGIVAVLFLHVRDNDISRVALYWLCLLGMAGLVGMLSMPTRQVIFGGWVLTPLIYGYASSRGGRMEGPVFRTCVAVLLVLACVGIIGNASISYPWVGANFELGGKEISGSREWHIGERQRLAGFSRSSFDAAGQIAVLSALLNAGEARRWLRGAVWLLAVTAVMLSTARGVLLAMLVVAIVVECTRMPWPAAFRMRIVQAATVVGLLWSALPPLLAWTVDFSQTARLQLHSAQGSYLDRLANMWPEALRLWWDSPLPVLGRGLGGIGAAQTLFESARFNAADNLMVYQCVTLGLLAIPICAVFASGVLRLASDSGPQRMQLSAIALILLWYGAVSNIVEHPVLALCYGRLLQHSFDGLRHRDPL